MGYYRTLVLCRYRYTRIGLDLSEFAGEHQWAIAAGETPDPMVYDLISVSNHSGTLSFGHYTAYARSFVDNEW